MNRTHDFVVSAYDGRSAYRLRDSEVRKLCDACIGNQNVVRLDVSMYNLIFMCEAECRCNLPRDADCLFIVDPTLFFNQLAERFSLYEFHNDEVDISLLSDIVNTYNIRMGKPCCRLRLSSEIFHKLRVLGKFRAQNFNRNISVQQTAFCLINDSHSAFSDFFNQFIPSG